MRQRSFSRERFVEALSGQSTLLAFCLLVLIGGSNAVAVRLSYSELTPFWGAGLRFGAAALIFWAVVLGRRLDLPRGRALAGALLYGLLTTGANYAFIYWALQRVQAGLTMVVLAFVPLMTLFFAWAHGLESLSLKRVAGALIAIAGILVVVAGGLGTAVHVPSFLALVAGAACLAEGTVIFKLFPKSHPLVTNAVALSASGPLAPSSAMRTIASAFVPRSAPPPGFVSARPIDSAASATPSHVTGIVKVLSAEIVPSDTVTTKLSVVGVFSALIASLSGTKV